MRKIECQEIWHGGSVQPSATLECLRCQMRICLVCAVQHDCENVEEILRETKVEKEDYNQPGEN